MKLSHKIIVCKPTLQTTNIFFLWDVITTREHHFLPTLLHLCDVFSGGLLFLLPHIGWSNLSSDLQSVSERLFYAFHHIELAQYTDDIALVAMSKQSALLVKYLETRLADLEIWLKDWRIAINVGKSAQLHSLWLDAFRHLVPYRAERIRNLAKNFDSKIPDAENLLFQQLDRYLFYPGDE